MPSWRNIQKDIKRITNVEDSTAHQTPRPCIIIPTSAITTLGNAIYDSVTVTSKDILGEGDTIGLALQCFQGDGGKDGALGQI